MEHVLMEVGKMIFLSKWVICRFQPFIFQGVGIPSPGYTLQKNVTEPSSNLDPWSPESRVWRRFRTWKSTTFEGRTATPQKFNSSPLKICLLPKGKDHLPSNHHFSGANMLVSGRVYKYDWITVLLGGTMKSLTFTSFSNHQTASRTCWHRISEYFRIRSFHVCWWSIWVPTQPTFCGMNHEIHGFWGKIVTRVV